MRFQKTALSVLFTQAAFLGLLTLGACGKKSGSKITAPESKHSHIDTLWAPQAAPLEKHVRWFQRHREMMKDKANRDLFAAWLKPLEPYRHAPLLLKAKAVDSLADITLTWVDDSITYQAPEYAAPPLMSIQKRQGDCEDYAILKYYALKHLGVSDKRCYVLGVATKGKDGRLDHAVCALDLSPGADRSRIVILDNRDEETHPGGAAPAFQATGYRPIYMVNPSQFTFLK